jgi:hypothetical protein
MKKTVTKKDPPPAPTCASLEATYNRLRDIVNDDGSGGWSDANKTTAGGAAHDVCKQGMAMGCSFSPPPSGPGAAS